MAFACLAGFLPYKNMKYICHDCKKELNKGDEYIPYSVSDKIYIKCKECYLNDPILRNFRLCEVYSRVCGYIRPTIQWNGGKRAEFNDRRVYNVKIHMD